MHRLEWPDDDGVDFHIGYGDWIRLLRANGFEVEDLIEIQAPDGCRGVALSVGRHASGRDDGRRRRSGRPASV